MNKELSFLRGVCIKIKNIAFSDINNSNLYRDEMHKQKVLFVIFELCLETQKELLRKHGLYVLENDEIEKLKAENKKLRDALSFYADVFNWDNDNHPYHNKSNSIEDCDLGEGELIQEKYLYYETGGKLARKVLKELGDE